MGALSFGRMFNTVLGMAGYSLSSQSMKKQQEQYTAQIEALQKQQDDLLASIEDVPDAPDVEDSEAAAARKAEAARIAAIQQQSLTNPTGGLGVTETANTAKKELLGN